MQTIFKKHLQFLVVIALAITLPIQLQAQEEDKAEERQEERSRFWDNVRFGGGLGLSFGNGFFGASVSPAAIYDVNQYVSVGPSLIFSYQEDDFFSSTLYGASLLTLINPIREIQLSAEVEQLRVNQNFMDFGVDVEDNFWNTALFLGGGYQTGGVTVGVRYNVLFNTNDRVYADAWAPFVRVFF
ncbi:MAG: hypothetical protein AAF466_03340 [Bacteroidota bacterium]